MSAARRDPVTLHRPTRRWLRRWWCVCGLAWPCLEQRLAIIDRRPERSPRPAWAAGSTQVLPQRGWIDRPTPAQV